MCAKVEEKASMISIKQLNEKKKFIVPTYQRGLRWSKEEVKTLLDDLFEFTLPENETNVYCLQSIVVRKISESEYEVIDGQQRLTVLWLISLIHFFQKRDRKSSSRILNYDIEFSGKEEYNRLISELIQRSIKTYENSDGEIEYYNFSSKFISKLKDEYKTFDSRNMIELSDYIINQYTCDNKEGERIDSSYIINKIFESLILDTKKDIRVIFDIMSTGEEGDNNSAVIDKFSKINSGKIGLTESELIKAYIMQGSDDDKAIAHQWEEIERSLCNDKFWYMFSDGNSQNNRMDKLFEIWYCSKSGNKYEDLKRKNHILSNAAVSYIKDLDTLNNDLTDRDKPADKLWKEIVNIHDTLLDWFNDFKLYHLIGLYLEMYLEMKEVIKSEGTVKIISKLYDDYSKQSRDSFINAIICNSDNSIEKMFTKIVPKEKFIENTVGNNTDDGLVPFSYEITEEKNKLKTILLLYNVALYYNANEINTANHYDRFPFDFYKNKKNQIEVEHINPQHPDFGNKVKVESDDGLSLVEKDDSKLFLDDYKDKFDIDTKNMTTKVYKEVYQELESSEKIHALGNLVLLDKKINGTYGNAKFKQKRKHIIAALYGLPFNDKNNKSHGLIETEKETLKYYRNSAIFPGTRQVFLREFSGKQADLDCWSKDNMNTYEKYIQSTICTFFGWEINK